MSGIGLSSSHNPNGSTRTSRSTAVGARQAISAAIMPPMEWPTTDGRRPPSPSASITSQAWRAKSSMSSSRSSPRDSPKPGSSGANTWWRSVSRSSFLDLLTERHHVFAPELPGFGESRGEEWLEDMLDFALHAWDVIEALGLAGRRPSVIGHSLGGMIAAEMACLAPTAVDRLVLVDPFGLWLDDSPIPDIFALLPYEFGDYLFHDPRRAAALLSGATDLADPESLRQFFIDNARRLGTAGKILFPIPNRRFLERLYPPSPPTPGVWGG